MFIASVTFGRQSQAETFNHLRFFVKEIFYGYRIWNGLRL